jgi:dihydrodipicolinate synthase/N-acetylneuraminate lyase
MTGDANFGRRQFLGAMAAGAAVMAMPRWAPAKTPTRSLAGIFPIGFTPVNAQDQIDYEGLAAQVKFCQRGGVQGFAWPQIASGWIALSEDERRQGAAALLSAARGGPTAVVIGVQSKTADAAETARYARQAELLGADAVICIAPPGVQPGPDLLAYYQKLGKETSLPIFIQTGGDFSVDLVMEMFNTIPTCRYIKDEAGDPLERIAEIRKRTNDQMKCFSGKGVNTMITEMERGFAGHCPYVSLADVYASAYTLYHAGNVQGAFDQFAAIEAANTLFAQSDVDVLIARGVFRPGTTTRKTPPAPGSDTRIRKHSSPEEIKHELDLYMKPYLKT